MFCYPNFIYHYSKLSRLIFDNKQYSHICCKNFYDWKFQQNYLIHTSIVTRKFVPDKSRLPVLNEKDLEEQFVQGSGPGGQNVNRLQNCVVLKHIPTGIVVKCHQERLLQFNRKLARKLMLERLDEHQNGPNSITEQKKRYVQSQLENKQRRASELREKKLEYKLSFKKQSSLNGEHESSNN